MLAGLAWGIGFFLSHKIASKKVKYLNWVLVVLFVSSWIGAKVFFLLTSDNIDKEAFIKSSNFWLGGGFVFYGGLIFGILSLLIFLNKTNQKLGVFSFLTIPLGVGHGLGRIGCFMAGCCYGTELDHTIFLSHIPVQLFEAIGLFTISYICFKKMSKNIDPFLFYLKAYAVLRFLLEFLRGDSIRGLYLGLSSSQLISIVIIMLVVVVDIRANKEKSER
jgi:phosphatidylglycerol:prolipoprotein diacylglycerol transferase